MNSKLELNIVTIRVYIKYEGNSLSRSANKSWFQILFLPPLDNFPKSFPGTHTGGSSPRR